MKTALLAIGLAMLTPIAAHAGTCKRVLETEEARSTWVKQASTGLMSPYIVVNVTNEGEVRLGVGTTVQGTIEREVPEGAVATLTLTDGTTLQASTPKAYEYMPYARRRTTETEIGMVTSEQDRTSVGAEFTLTEDALQKLQDVAVASVDLPFHREEGARWTIELSKSTQKKLVRGVACGAAMQSGAEKPRTIKMY